MGRWEAKSKGEKERYTHLNAEFQRIAKRDKKAFLSDILTCIQISQEADQVVWYSHLFQNFPEFLVIHIVKGFVIVSKAEVDVFLELSCFFTSHTVDVTALSSVTEWV